jgi:hypothetical protein
MIITFMTDRGPDGGRHPDWQPNGVAWGTNAELSARVPGKGELVQIDLDGDSRMMRVIEICQTRPLAVEVYLVPTYVKVP